jgi:hypothetical protein
MSETMSWEQLAKRKTPEQWANEIASLPVKNEMERCKIANIIWWDYFSEKSFKENWTHLNALLNKCDASSNVKPERVEELLVLLGWPEKEAHYRSLVGNTKHSSDQGSNRDAGAEACLYAVCEQAILDFKNLSESGVIVHGRVREGWPAVGSYGSLGYHNRREVEQLIKWIVDGSLQKAMRSLGCFVEENVLMTSLRLQGLGQTTDNEGHVA